MNLPDGADQKPATAARIYDYVLGGTHNFPADREAAREAIALFPDIPVAARANRAFLRRAVRFLADAGIRQFLDIGSGMPTEGNVHEIAQAVAAHTRVVYVDLDPLAVAESADILEGNDTAIAIHADLRHPDAILAHRRLRNLLDFDAPIALLLVAILHFLPDDEAHQSVQQLVGALPPGSYLAISNIAAETFAPDDDRTKTMQQMYRQKVGSSVHSRTQAQVERFFGDRFELVDPGVVYLGQWRPDPQADQVDAHRSSAWAAVGKLT